MSSILTTILKDLFHYPYSFFIDLLQLNSFSSIEKSLFTKIYLKKTINYESIRSYLIVFQRDVQIAS